MAGSRSSARRRHAAGGIGMSAEPKVSPGPSGAASVMLAGEAARVTRATSSTRRAISRASSRAKIERVAASTALSALRCVVAIARSMARTRVSRSKGFLTKSTAPWCRHFTASSNDAYADITTQGRSTSRSCRRRITSGPSKSGRRTSTSATSKLPRRATAIASPPDAVAIMS
jgi:hypothetical protein